MKILSDPLMIMEWDPWIKSVSLISMSNAEESSSRFSGDVISVMEGLNYSSWISETINILANLLKSDQKLYSRLYNVIQFARSMLLDATTTTTTIGPMVYIN